MQLNFEILSNRGIFNFNENISLESVVCLLQLHLEGLKSTSISILIIDTSGQKLSNALKIENYQNQHKSVIKILP